MIDARARVCLFALIGLCAALFWISRGPSDAPGITCSFHSRDDVQYFAPGPDFPLPDEEPAVAESERLDRR